MIKESERLISGSQNMYTCEFTFDESWDGYAVTAVFSTVNRLVNMAVVDGKCDIPVEVLRPNARIRIGIFGVDGDRSRPTTYSDWIIVEQGADMNGNAGEPPTPSVYEQWMNTLDEKAASLVNDQKFVPIREEWEDYADAMADGVASYLCNMAEGTTDCVVGKPKQDHPFAAVYNDVYSTIYADLMTYDALVNKKTTFGHYTTSGWTPMVDGNHDVVDISSGRYPILYMNCSGFVTLLTKGRDYKSSPYYRLFSDPDATPMQLASCCLEKGDTDTAPWTFDCHNVLLTWRMAERMRASGCTPFQTAYKDGDTSYDTDAIKKLRDGDLLFSGNENTNGSRYLGINHCLMYFADLNRLNNAAAAYGVSLCAFDGGNGEFGYVVHCTGSSDGVVRGTKNVLRIETLEHYMSSALAGTKLWGVRVASNALNSAKLYQGITGQLMLHDCVVKNGWRHNSQLDRIPVTSIEPVSDDNDHQGVFSYIPYRYNQPYSVVSEENGVRYLDCNDFIGAENAGLYCVWEFAVELRNGPTVGNVTSGSAYIENPTDVYFLIETVDVTSYPAYSLQRISTLYDKVPRVWERVINYNKETSLWREMVDATRVQNMVAKAFPTDTASGAPAVFNDGAGGFPVADLKITFPPTQEGSGDPSPSNIRPVIGYERCEITATGNAYPVVETIPVDGKISVGGGTLDVLYGELKKTWVRIVFDGSEQWGAEYTASFYTGALRHVLPDNFKQNLSGHNGRLMCSHFPSKTPDGSVTYENVWFSKSRYLNVQFPGMTRTGTAMQAWVKEQYDKGTPFTVLICLEEPETVSLPPREVKTAKGENTISASCGNVSVTYRADPTLYIDKKIAALTAAGSEE